MAIGPDLPPHLLAKRKRQAEQDEQCNDAEFKRIKTPPPNADKQSSRISGPTAPPAPLDQRPLKPAEVAGEDSDDSDDDFGPSLPTGDVTDAAPVNNAHNERSNTKSTSHEPSGPVSKRDDWMTVPPKQDDLAARSDPTRLRARGFNTSKSARTAGEGDGISQVWTETPEQKRQRLSEQVMGTGKSTAEESRRTQEDATKRDEDRERAAKIKQSRGQSLYDSHRTRADLEKDDDPSQRTFDRDRDMGLGVKLGEKQRRELVSKAADFGSKFSSGKFL